MSAVDLWLLEQDHILTRKKKKNVALWKGTRQYIKILLVTNFSFKAGLDYKIKQQSKEILQFTKVFPIYFIFKNSRM